MTSQVFVNKISIALNLPFIRTERRDIYEGVHV